MRESWQIGLFGDIPVSVDAGFPCVREHEKKVSPTSAQLSIAEQLSLR